MRGVVSFSVDPNTLTSIDDTWAEQVKGMGFAFVRTPMPTDTNGRMPAAAYNRAFAAYRRAGLPVRVVLNPGFLPAMVPAGSNYPLFPNGARNTKGDQLSSPFIDVWSLRAAAVLRYAPLVEAVYIWNEPNELGMLHPGVFVPPGAKGGSLAPDVCAALYWQAAKRIKHYRPDIKVYCGALSLLPQTGLDAHNPYLAQYLEAFYQTFVTYHQGHPWPWDGWSLNMEGYWTLPKVAAAIDCVRTVMAKHSDTGILTIGEWGTRNIEFDQARAKETYDAFSTVLDGEGCFFQDPANIPSYDLNGYTEWGLSLWQQDNNAKVFRRLGALPWQRFMVAALGGYAV